MQQIFAQMANHICLKWYAIVVDVVAVEAVTIRTRVGVHGDLGGL